MSLLILSLKSKKKIQKIVVLTGLFFVVFSFFQNCSQPGAIQLIAGSDHFESLAPNNSSEVIVPANPIVPDPIAPGMPESKPISGIVEIKIDNISSQVSRDLASDFILKIVITKPQDRDLKFKLVVYGDAQFGIDHGFSAGEYTLPAKSTTASIKVPILANPSVKTSKRLYIGIVEVSDNEVQISNSHIAAIDLVSSKPKLVTDLGLSDFGIQLRCVSMSDGSAKCWGKNHTQNLISSTPFDVQFGSNEKVKSIATSVTMACGVFESGRIKCWGKDNDFKNHEVPTDIDNQNDYVSIAAGNNRGRYVFCALTLNQTVRCWGYSTALGDGVSTSSEVPVEVKSTVKFQQIALGSSYSCALGVDHQVYCWGENTRGPFGDETLPELVKMPTRISTISYAEKLFAGLDTICYLDKNSYAYCSSDKKFTLINNKDQFKQVSIGLLKICGVTLDSRVRCRGFNDFVKLPEALNAGYQDFYSYDESYRYQSIQAGFTSICGLTVDGNVRCSGRNDSSQLGNGLVDGELFISNANHFMDSSTLTTMSSGDSSNGGSGESCALTNKGKILCWGTMFGKFRSLPVSIDGSGDRYSLISNPTKNSICALRETDSSLVCFHSNSTGQLIKEIYESNVLYTQLSISGSGFCGLTSRGLIRCRIPFSSPSKEVDPGVAYKNIIAADNHYCAIDSADQIRCWGSNTNGQVNGISSTLTIEAPVLVDSGYKYKQVKADSYTTCGLTLDSKLRCWGKFFPYVDSSSLPRTVTTYDNTVLTSFDLNSDLGGVTTNENQFCFTPITTASKFCTNIPRPLHQFGLISRFYFNGIDNDGHLVSRGYNLDYFQSGNGKVLISAQFVRKLTDP